MKSAAFLVLLAVPVLGCGPTTPSPEHSTSLSKAFEAGFEDYKDAVNNGGFELDKPGAGSGPISHVSLFETYKHCFYLPASAEPLMSHEAIPLLREKSASANEQERTFAKACLAIVESMRRLKRSGVYRWSLPIKAELLLYHYD